MGSRRLYRDQALIAMSQSSNAVPQPTDLLITGGCVVTLDANSTIHYPGSVAISNGSILAIGPSSEIDSAYMPQERLQARDHVVMPGLINIHGHASNSLIRGLGSDLPLHEWLQKVCWPCMSHADDEDIYNGVLLSCLEMLLNGVTTFADMWAGVGLAAEAVAVSGGRALLAHNIKDFDDPARGERELAIAIEAWERWNGYAGGRVMVGLGPHSVYACRRELLAACADVARSHEIHLQVHGSETAREVEECRAQYGCSPIELMAEVGLLGQQTIVAHAVHLDDSDIQLLQSTASSVAYNIVSNLKLASGIAPVHRYLAAGICVGIGTDGPGSNDGLDLLGDLKYATLVQKVITGDATCLPAETALAMATHYGAQALGIGDRLGTLEVGKQADIILVNLDQPRFTPRHFSYAPNILSLLVACATGADVDTVIVGGQILVRDSQPVSLDPAAIQENAQQSSVKILRASGIL
ncbi:MAG: amidohydrolase family protein [Anaerolineae bacterium]